MRIERVKTGVFLCFFFNIIYTPPYISNDKKEIEIVARKTGHYIRQ